ncbi:ABC transporter permease [Kaistia algarum]|uniref:ABC transporter permease n=1 Tax=Kaistia algarum TaxID=2083279 RepID=UPI000CE8EC0D|nr:ABC transporter permease [Kaistia algarum]MCX5515500.1 ABC transporter permease [Kaistia algarum]PPE81096.1 ABC transporter permease [Kaistia algarum]
MSDAAPAVPSPLKRLMSRPWLWAYVAAMVVWVITILFTGGRSGGEVLTAAFTFATFSVIVGIGQMYVVTLGPGNVDLSIPATITLAGAVATKVMDTQDGMILVGLLVALACGIGVGIFNYALILLLRIPPIIATLSSSFLVQSAAIAYGRGIRIKPPPALADFTTSQVLGMPVLAICVIALAAVMELVLRRTLYGRWVTAIGQNIRAARLAGVPVGRTRFAAYIMSAVFAGLCGYLLSGFSGGSSLSMGEEYLLTSIALVVIGGSSVAGGNSNVPGLWGAALFLFLVVTMLNTYGFGAGLRYLATGGIIIAVIVAASRPRSTR